MPYLTRPHSVGGAPAGAELNFGLRAFVVDSITSLGEEVRGCAVLAASHGGEYVAHSALKLGVSAVILSDAGVGRERAGIAGLATLERFGVPGATVGHRTARIGDGADCFARGVISYANAPARAAGLRPGMTAQEALKKLEAIRPHAIDTPCALSETRQLVRPAEGGNRAVWTLDSASLVAEQDKGSIVVTGSHGGLLGGRPESAIKFDVYAAIYNDADRGVDNAGASRLGALDERGIVGATVSAWSARIGDGLSTYHEGVISAMNRRAHDLGGEIGLSTTEFVARLLSAR